MKIKLKSLIEDLGAVYGKPITKYVNAYIEKKLGRAIAETDESNFDLQKMAVDAAQRYLLEEIHAKDFIARYIEFPTSVIRLLCKSEGVDVNVDYYLADILSKRIGDNQDIYFLLSDICERNAIYDNDGKLIEHRYGVYTPKEVDAVESKTERFTRLLPNYYNDYGSIRNLIRTGSQNGKSIASAFRDLYVASSEAITSAVHKLSPRDMESSSEDFDNVVSYNKEVADGDHTEQDYIRSIVKLNDAYIEIIRKQNELLKSLLK